MNASGWSSHHLVQSGGGGDDNCGDPGGIAGGTGGIGGDAIQSGKRYPLSAHVSGQIWATVSPSKPGGGVYTKPFTRSAT